MTFFLQLIVSGIIVGGLYALLGLSIVMIYKATGIFNFATGELMGMGMFLCWTFIEIGIAPWISIIAALALLALLGWLINRAVLASLIGHPMIVLVVATFALVFILKGVMQLFWPTKLGIYPRFLPGETVEMGPLMLSPELLWTFIISMIVFGLTVLLFQRSRIGLAMRATHDNQVLAQIRGISVKKIFDFTWAIGAMICAVGGIFLAYRIGVNYFVPSMGLFVIPAILLGGLDSIPGVIVGGIALGLILSLTSGFLSPELSSIMPYIVLMIVLIFKTEGLFGSKRIERI